MPGKNNKKGKAGKEPVNEPPITTPSTAVTESEDVP